MLRGLVLLLLVANVALYFWIRTDPAWTQADRDPQRAQLQVAPERVTYVPDAASRGAAASAAEGAGAVLGARTGAAAGAASTPASGATVTVAATGAAASGTRPAASGVANASCIESAPLGPADVTALQQLVAGAGVPTSAVSLRADPQPARWMVYMGRFADAAQAQTKADELRRLNVTHAPVGKPAALAPGLSLGVFGSEANAQAHLVEVGKRGVHTARIVPLEGDAGARRVQLKPVDPTWQKKLPADRFGACAA